MTDPLMRDVPSNIVAALDADASRRGPTRSGCLRPSPTRAVAGTGHTDLTIEDLAGVAEVFADLTDDDTMREAWR